jgi:hypothetical protein
LSTIASHNDTTDPSEVEMAILSEWHTLQLDGMPSSPIVQNVDSIPSETTNFLPHPKHWTVNRPSPVNLAGGMDVGRETPPLMDYPMKDDGPPSGGPRL